MEERGAEASAEAKAIDLEEFLRMLPFLEAADLMAMSAAYQRADAEARDAARTAASAAAKRRRVGDELGRLQGSIIQWAGSDISRSSAFTLDGPQTSVLLGDLRVHAVPALLDAATALVLGSALSPEDREALFEPFDSAVG